MRKNDRENASHARSDHVFGFTLTGIDGLSKHSCRPTDNQNDPDRSPVRSLSATKERLASLASYLRCIDAGDSELEIFIHNWARLIERVALEMEFVGLPLKATEARPLDSASAPSTGNSGRTGCDRS
ncbi:MAG: hypothetical protein R3C97_12915 [Geminicoccaceae bacterium]